MYNTLIFQPDANLFVAKNAVAIFTKFGNINHV